MIVACAMDEESYCEEEMLIVGRRYYDARNSGWGNILITKIELDDVCDNEGKPTGNKRTIIHFRFTEGHSSSSSRLLFSPENKVEWSRHIVRFVGMF